MQNTKDLHQEIMKLEKSFWQAMRDDDLERIVELTDFPCLVAGAQGSRAFEKEEFQKMFESGEGKIKDFKLDEDTAEVRQVAPDAAVIAYKVKSTFSHEGKDKTIEAVDTSTWVKRGTKWACAMHTETELPKQ